MMQNNGITIVHTAEAPAPGGHYAQAARLGDVMFISGQLGVTKETPAPAGVGVTEQLNFALGNMEAIAQSVGADRNSVVKCTIFVTDISDWEEINLAYAQFFGVHRPARSVVPCGLLHFGARIEVEAVVAVPPGADVQTSEAKA